MNKKLVLNLISLLVTSVLLIMVVFSWYISNDTVKASGVTGTVQDYQSIIEEINVYYATKVTDTQYTKGDLVPEGDQMIYDQFPEVYDPTTHGGVAYSTPPRLIELVLKTGKQLTALDMISNTTYFPGTDNTENPGYVVEDDLTGEVSIALSPFLKFNQATLNGNTITVTSFTGYEYNETTGVIVNNTKNLINQPVSPRVYLLLDFDDEKFNLLYSNNIGNDVIDTADQINHFTDFKLMVFGGDL